MKTRVSVFSSFEPDGGIITFGARVTGPGLAFGQRGRCELEAGTVEIEIIGLGEVHEVPNKPNIQLVQAKILKGNPRSLEGTIIEFS